MAVIQRISDAQIDHWFTYHNDASKVPNYKAVNEAAKYLAKVIRDNCPPGADAERAILQVRDARMTANLAIACDGW